MGSMKDIIDSINESGGPPVTLRLLKQAINSMKGGASSAERYFGHGDYRDAASTVIGSSLSVLEDIGKAIGNQEVKGHLKAASASFYRTLDNIKEKVSEENIEEAISEGAVDRLIDAMFLSPRVVNLFNRYGVGLGVDMLELRRRVTPVIKLWFADRGQRVSGASAARAAVRSMGRT